MERISGLPELTPEEIAEQKEKEYAPQGTAIAVKYLDGVLSADELPAELKRFSGEPQAIVRRALVSALCREIQLEKGPDSATRALDGLAQLAPPQSNLAAEAGKNYFELLGRFDSAKEKSLREFGNSASEPMKALGISGSAVRPNLNENELWKQELDRIRQSFEPELDRLVARLARELT